MKKVVLDCLGEICQTLLPKVENAIKDLQSGDVLVIQVNQLCGMTNVPKWARESGHDVEIVDVDESEWEIVISKK